MNWSPQRGEGVKNPENFADVLCTRPISYFLNLASGSMDAYYAYLPAWQVFAATHKACNGVSDSRPPPLPSSLPDALRFSLAAAAIIRALAR